MFSDSRKTCRRCLYCSLFFPGLFLFLFLVLVLVLLLFFLLRLLFLYCKDFEHCRTLPLHVCNEVVPTKAHSSFEKLSHVITRRLLLNRPTAIPVLNGPQRRLVNCATSNALIQLLHRSIHEVPLPQCLQAVVKRLPLFDPLLLPRTRQVGCGHARTHSLFVFEVQE